MLNNKNTCESCEIHSDTNPNKNENISASCEKRTIVFKLFIQFLAVSSSDRLTVQSIELRTVSLSEDETAELTA
jgi:hypothetical protein